MKALIFDFDGVIHDTFEFHLSRIQKFLNKSIPIQQFRDMHNGNFFSDAPDELKNVTWENYRDYIYDEQSTLTIQKDIRDIILDLSTRYDLYIITSGGQKNITDYLGNNGILAHFQEVLGLESHTTKDAKFTYVFETHNLKPDDCLFITDTLGDILEANKVNIKTIALDFGFHDRETLKQGKPYKIISNWKELYQFLD